MKTWVRIPISTSSSRSDSPNQLIKFFALKPWDQREQNSWQVQQDVQGELTQFPVFNNFFVGQPPPLPSTFGAQVQFVISTTESFDRLNEVVQAFMTEVNKSGRFFFAEADLRVDRPQVTVEIDREKAAVLGLSMSDVGNALSAMLGGGYINYFSMEGRSYRVMAQADQPFRLNPEQVLNYYIRTPNGGLVQLSTIATISQRTTPQSVNAFPAAQLGDDRHGRDSITQGDALTFLQDLAARTLPEGYLIDYAGESRQYIQEFERLPPADRVRADHRLPFACGAVRELSRSVRHPARLGSDVGRGRDAGDDLRLGLGRVLSAHHAVRRRHDGTSTRPWAWSR